MSKKTIGERIKAKREKLDLSRDIVAKAIGVSAPALRGWEEGFNEPHPSRIEAIKAWLNGAKS